MIILNTIRVDLLGTPEAFEKKPVVEFCHAGGLGDAWCYTSMLLRVAEFFQKDVRVCFPDTEKGELQRKRLAEILPLLDAPTHMLMPCSEYPNAKLVKAGNDSPKYYPTRDRWKGKGRLHCTYQFDAYRDYRRPPPNEESVLVEQTIKAAGIESQIKVGGHLGLASCIATMADSEFFYGVNSGMAHVCFSVGTPMYVIQYWNSPKGDRDFRKWFSGKKFVHCRSTAEYVEAVKARKDLQCPTVKL